jgi:nucleotide-binding universal stress UspA family protein
MLPIYTILYPTDFSENAQRAFPLACALARDCGARVFVLHVMPLPLGHDQLVARRNPEEYYGGTWDMLFEVQPPDTSVSVEHLLEEGDAAKEILAVAQEIQAELIIMGTHGRTGLGRVLLGSVAEQVLRKASCPVLTIKTPSAVAWPGQAGPVQVGKSDT